MQKDLVFFKKEDEEGVALTSTSANHIANLAKEYIQGVEAQLNRQYWRCKYYSDRGIIRSFR